MLKSLRWERVLDWLSRAAVPGPNGSYKIHADLLSIGGQKVEPGLLAAKNRAEVSDVNTLQTTLDDHASRVAALEAAPSGGLFIQAADGHYIQITVGAGPGYALSTTDTGTTPPVGGVVAPTP